MIKKLNAKSINQIFKLFASHNPKPTTELIYHSPFELLIAVILSAQATDVSVNKVTPHLFKLANTPAKIAKLGVDKLQEIIKTIGLYKTKAHNIIKTCEILKANYTNDIPDSMDELIKLPGVGRKTANVLLNTVFNQATIAVDTHIFRVSNRIGLSNGKTPLEVENQLNQVIPDKYKLDAHHWLILHGRYTCIARNPKCSTCIIKDYCNYPDKTV